MVFHWIYTPFIYNIFFKFPNHLLKKENNIHFLIYLFGGKPKRNRASKRKHSKFNVPINIMQVPWNVLEMLLKFSSFLHFSKYHDCNRRTELLVLFFVFSEAILSLKLFISSSEYSCYEKGCRKKCTRQSRKVLWVVLSSLFSKEKWKNRDLKILWPRPRRTSTETEMFNSWN